NFTKRLTGLFHPVTRETPGPVHDGRRDAARRQRSRGPALSGISLAAANGLLSFPSMRQIQPPRRRSRRSRSRSPARPSRPRRQPGPKKFVCFLPPHAWVGPHGPPAFVSSLFLFPS